MLNAAARSRMLEKFDPDPAIAILSPKAAGGKQTSKREVTKMSRKGDAPGMVFPLRDKAFLSSLDPANIFRNQRAARYS